MGRRTICDIDVQGKRVLVRVNFDVPLAKGTGGGRIVADDTRIRAALPTICFLRDQGAVVLLCSHLGWPKGQVEDDLRMDPIAACLSDLLGHSVTKLDDCVGSEVEAAAWAARPGDVLLLENTRFHAGENRNDPEFAAELAALAELHVNDASGIAPRTYASNEGVARHLPTVIGFLLEKEGTLAP